MIARMADFEEYAEIISRCIGNAENEFIRAYHENKKLQTDAALEARPIATVIVKLMESQEIWRWWYCDTTTTTRS